MATKQQIIETAQKSLRAAYDKFPMGCDEDQMKEFLETQPYPDVAYAILTVEDYSPFVNKYVCE